MSKLRLLFLFTGVLLAACGFRLQGSGSGSLPPEFSSTYIQAKDHYTPFYRSLSKGIVQRGGKLASSPASATAIVEILGDVSDQTVTAVSSRNTPLEYEAYYSVTFAVVVNGAIELTARPITLTNRYEYIETKVLGMEEQFDRFATSQAEDITRQVLVQISTL